MPVYLNISIALVVFMGLASGGILSLVLMSERRQQGTFTIMLTLSMLLAVSGGAGMVSILPSVAASLTNALILLVLSFALGYTLTSFSVLSPAGKRWPITLPEEQLASPTTAVILLTPGEPPNYTVNNAAGRLELADNPGDVPPILLRPFYMSDLKSKYRKIGRSPYTACLEQLAQSVESRLDPDYNVHLAYYNSQPLLPEVVVQAVEGGAKRIIVAHVRVTDPPDPVMRGDLLNGLDLGDFGVRITQVGPMWVSNLLPQIYVRRILEAVPQEGTSAEDIGILLVGRGHGPEGGQATARQDQESSFLRKVRAALVRVGFSDTRIATGWVRAVPTCGEALQSLIAAGCKTVYLMPASFVADGITTLYDVPAQIDSVAQAGGVRLVSLQAWNADELAAEEIASYIRTASTAPLAAVGS